jgi:hypothetical protein
MYEYIPNTIIEGTLKALIYTTHSVFLVINNVWEHVNASYFEDMEYYDSLQEIPTNKDSGEVGEIGWDCEYQDCLTNMYNYFFEGSSYTEYNTKDNDTANGVTSSTLNKKQVDYADKYKDMWKQKETTSGFKPKEQINTVHQKHNVLIENTPFGNVIMYYDSAKESFIYYCDKTLSYPIINTVGRKYALTFGCECLYIDETSATTVQPSEQQPAPAPAPTTTAPPAEKSTVYAKFKNYKNQPKNKIPNSTAGPSSTNQPELINRYTCEGKLSNFSFLQKTPKVKKISYKDFKNKLSPNSKSPSTA